MKVDRVRKICTLTHKRTIVGTKGGMVRPSRERQVPRSCRARGRLYGTPGLLSHLSGNIRSAKARNRLQKKRGIKECKIEYQGAATSAHVKARRTDVGELATQFRLYGSRPGQRFDKVTRAQEMHMRDGPRGCARNSRRTWRRVLESYKGEKNLFTGPDELKKGIAKKFIREVEQRGVIDLPRDIKADRQDGRGRSAFTCETNAQLTKETTIE